MGACSGNKFMILQIAPGGHAVVGGPQLDFPVGKLMALASGALVRTGLTPHNLPADCSNERADECSTWTNSSKAAISIAK
jgi:hypothetical protein